MAIYQGGPVLPQGPTANLPVNRVVRSLQTSNLTPPSDGVARPLSGQQWPR